MNKWEPWNESSAWKTKASFYAWLRGQLRRSIWQHYPPKNEYKASMLRPATQEDYKKGISPRTKKVGQCAHCQQWFPASKLQVDHVSQAGTLRDEDDIKDFVKRLACTKDNLALACKKCHDVKTLADKKNITFDEAVIEKRIIEKSKLPIEKQKKVLTSHYLPCHNAEARKESWRKYIEQEL